jgi:hypothetical protein
MAVASGKDDRGASRKSDGGTLPPPKARPGLPDPGSIVGKRTFVSPKGTRYEVLRTNEKDAYEGDEAPPGKKKD